MAFSSMMGSIAPVVGGMTRGGATGGAFGPGATNRLTAPPTGAPGPAAPPAQMMPRTQPDVMQTSANLFNQAAQGPNFQQFYNPYQQQVIDGTMQDMNRGRQMTMNDIGAQATQANAFGGSRHGIAEAESNRGYFDTMGRTVAGLRSDGFNNAMNYGFQNQGNQSQLAGQGFGFGMGLNQQQMQQGALQQQQMQQLIDAAKMQYAGFTGAPAAGVGLVGSAIGSVPEGGGSIKTSSSNPGLLGLVTALIKG